MAKYDQIMIVILYLLYNKYSNCGNRAFTSAPLWLSLYHYGYHSYIIFTIVNIVEGLFNKEGVEGQRRKDQDHDRR